MEKNKYDDKAFFEKYSRMERSMKGLDAAGEWKTLEKMLPAFNDKRVLDLGCGFGWHCQYAIEHGAKEVFGIDISERMLIEAQKKTNNKIKYFCIPIEDINFPKDSFDVVISSLAFHYLVRFEDVVKKVKDLLVVGGNFVFSVEHPIFTAYGSQDWYYDESGEILHFPVDNYFSEGERKAIFLGEEILKYHKTLTTYLNGLIEGGFEITGVAEPQPSEDLLKSIEGMQNELRRPMMLIVSSQKRQ